MSGFKALVISEDGQGGYQQSLCERDFDSLPAGEVLIRVRYSSLNYKDALSATGNKGVTRRYPHTPGIDVAGVVEQSAVSEFVAGDEVIVTGYDLGMNTSGGFAQYVRVPAAWLLKRPKGLTLRESMALGTAGLTAALCVEKLEQSGLTPSAGPVLVTGATGGVGSIAVALLASRGYDVVACSGKADAVEWLKSLGAREVIAREQLQEGSEKPLLKEQWGGAVDTVGGDILFNGQVAALWRQCGLLRADGRNRLQGERAAVHSARGQSAGRGFGGAAAGGQGFHVGQAFPAVEA